MQARAWLALLVLVIFLGGMFTETSTSIVNLAPGMVMPPFGVNLFAACTVTNISMEKLVRPLLPFVAVVMACLLIITYWPDLSLYLRDLAYR